MKTICIKIAWLCLIFIGTHFGLNAQDINPDSWKWGEDPTAPVSKQMLLRMEKQLFTQGKNKDKTKAIYAALMDGDIIEIGTHFAIPMIWHSKQNYIFNGLDPQIGDAQLYDIFFDETTNTYTSWKLDNLVFEEKFNNLITVTGSYTAYGQEHNKSGNFLHVWTWKNGQAINFQHYELATGVAERR